MLTLGILNCPGNFPGVIKIDKKVCISSVTSAVFRCSKLAILGLLSYSLEVSYWLILYAVAYWLMGQF